MQLERILKEFEKYLICDEGKPVTVQKYVESLKVHNFTPEKQDEIAAKYREQSSKERSILYGIFWLFSLMVSIIWIIVMKFLITALLITAAYLAIVCVIFIGLAFVFSAGSFLVFFESRK